MKHAIFFDRDGVLVQSETIDGRPMSARCLEDFIIAPDAPLALESVKKIGIPMACITNQPDLARGLLSSSSLDAMHRKMCLALPLNYIGVCRHDDSDNCACRKPKPGLIYSAAQYLGVRPDESVLIGDRWRDIDAGKNAGCFTIFIDRGYDETLRATPDIQTTQLPDAVDYAIKYLSDM